MFINLVIKNVFLFMSNAYRYRRVLLLVTFEIDIKLHIALKIDILCLIDKKLI
jgi:hypothetical protein